ncbi:MAG TPA: crosslink repair DNA glycosylase YcaQ family protein [Rectinemataceae bacterium]|nr:crosslink repair DNA glycosylase YcaQ family protein [Rectinemataceae bacterium]
MAESIDIGGARRIAVRAAGLGRPFAAGDAGEAIRHLSAVQIDTISVVERAHHHILWSRVPRYARAQLGRLEAEPRRIIEYWSHAAAYLPIEEYRYCLPRMERVRTRGHDWFEADERTVAMVRERIAAEGPLQVRDFGGAKAGSAGWWDWKPAKVALEYLFHAGELVSLGREGFQKRYDLAERALPADLDLRRPSAGEMAAYYVDVAARALGVFTEADVAYGRRDLVDGIPNEIAQRVEAGSLVGLRLEGSEAGKSWYAPPGLLAEAGPATEDGEATGGDAGSPTGAGGGRARVFLLSPFDPLVIDRRRTKRLFGVEFQIECYLPARKRSFGYFALPLLFRGADGAISFAGRLDAKADRGRKTLILRRLSVSGISPQRRVSFAAALAAEVRRYAAFNGCEASEPGLVEADDAALEAAIGKRLGAAGETESH